MANVQYSAVTQRYPGADAPTVDNLDLDIADGEFLVLVGPSGCGKSTTLRVLAGLEPIESGRISIGDVDVTHLPPRARDVAMVFQNYALYPNMTVAANMGFALRNAGMSRADTRRRVLEVADRGLLALVLDSLAIAAQSLVGAALGAGDAGHAKAVAWRVTAFSLLAAGILAAALGLGSSVLPGLFTDDRSVLAAIGVPWWFMVVQLPFAGIVFAVDGVLLGAGDAAFMRTATVASALVGFLPLVWLSLAYGWGLAGIWSGLGTFIVLRLIFVGWRAYSGRWAVTGAA